MLAILARLLLNLLALLAHAPRAALYHLARLRRRRAPPLWIQLRLPARLPLQPPRWLAALRTGSDQAQRLAWDERTARLAEDPRVHGVVLDLERAGEGGWALAETYCALVERLRDAGKQVAVHGNALGTRQLLVAARAHRIALSPPGGVELTGLHLGMTFYADALRALGVHPQFVHIGPYKTAAHRFLRSAPSRHQRENLERIADGLCASVSERVARRNLAPRDWLDAGLLDAGQARARGLVDALVYPDALRDWLGGDAAADKTRPRLLRERDWTPPPRLRWRPLVRQPRIVAVVDISGTIMMGDEGGGGLSRRPGTTWLRLRRTLERLERNRRVAAVVFVVDSPGGSALASDLIWRQGTRIAAAKPLVAAFEGVAASGGYYVAACCQRIFACETTLTGSIGVVAGRFSIGGLLDKLHVRHAAVERGRFAAMRSANTPLDRAAMRALRQSARATYRRFVARVADGRGLPRERVHELGQGRVYTGRQALELGLVDELGDLHRAIEHASALAGLTPSRRAIEVYPRRPGGLRAMLGASVAFEAAELARTFELARLLEREPVLALAPELALAGLTASRR